MINNKTIWITAGRPLLAKVFVGSLALFLTSCEGFKILTVYNQTGQPISVQTQPELPIFRHTVHPDTAPVLAGAQMYEIPADSSLVLLAAFGPLLFNAKIREKDLAIDYLTILTPKDSIVAHNRTEILKLTKAPRTRFRKRTDKHFAVDDNKNIEAIIIRQ